MKTFFIGIDISKDWLDVAVCDGTSKEVLQVFRTDNSFDGVEDLIAQTRELTKRYKRWYCFEHTGNYGLLLAQLLENHKLTYSAVPAIEIKQSSGMTRGKSDVVDAKRIALYAATYSHKLIPSSLPGESILKIKNMLTCRSQFVKLATQLKNSRKSYLVASKISDVSGLVTLIDERLAQLEQDVKKLESAIEMEIKASRSLQENYQKMKTVTGIGNIIAMYLLVHTNNFTSFKNPRKFNCYSGVAPFEHSSGSSYTGKTKTSKLRNKTIKTLLFNGANSAAIWDKELKTYYKRKIKEGKAHQSVINAIACKLIYRVFAVVKRDEPYVKLVR